MWHPWPSRTGDGEKPIHGNKRCLKPIQREKHKDWYWDSPWDSPWDRRGDIRSSHTQTRNRLRPHRPISFGHLLADHLHWCVWFCVCRREPSKKRYKWMNSERWMMIMIKWTYSILKKQEIDKSSNTYLILSKPDMEWAAHDASILVLNTHNIHGTTEGSLRGNDAKYGCISKWIRDWYQTYS